MQRLLLALGVSDAPAVPSAGKPTERGIRPGAGLPYLHAHFLRIWEKQRQRVAPNPTVGETLQTPGRGLHTSWAVHHQLGEWCKKPSNNV